MHRLIGVFTFPRAKAARHQCVYAAPHSNQEAGKQSNQRCGRTDRAKGFRAGKTASNGNIRHVEQNLKHVGEHQRQAEA